MEFYVSQQAALIRRPQLEQAGRALNLRAGFTDVDAYHPGGRSNLARYLDDYGIEFFSVDEVVTPHRPAKARKAGFDELVPPLHLWAWMLLTLAMGDELRRTVGRPVLLRNLYRPMSYNRLVAKSDLKSDHPNASAGDFDFKSKSDRQSAEQVVRDRAMSSPELELSLGMGARSLHVGVMSPMGGRHWFYPSYDDERRALAHGKRAPQRSEEEDVHESIDDILAHGSDTVSIDIGKTPQPQPLISEAVFDEEIKLRIIAYTAVHESAGNYGAVNPDGEFAGAFDNERHRHPASGKYHIGLSYGIVQFTQDSGTLGSLLAAMRRRNPEQFAEIFGHSSDALVDLTTRSGSTSRNSPPRGARVRPLDGTDLWDDVWVRRFQAAGRYEPFREEQLLLAVSLYLDPLVLFASWLGLNTDRALGMVFDRAVQLGVGGARRWIMEQVGPITDDEMLEQVLDAFGFENLREFQNQITGLSVDGAFGPQTHAAMCSFERQLPDDAAFVMHVPDRETMMDMMEVGAAGQRWHQRITKLRNTSAFDDVPLAL